MSGRVWLKAAACAALAVGGAAVSPENGALAAGAIAAGLGSGAAGNLFHELFGKGEDKLADLFSGRNAIDENHHVLLALRQAHLRALGAVVDSFENLPGAESGDLVKLLRKHLEEAGQGQAGVAAGRVSDVETALFDRLSRSFDSALAARGSAGVGRLNASVEEAEAARAEIESAVLAELGAATGNLRFPEWFVVGFRRAGGGWFGLFVRDAADRLKSNEAFRAIWQSEKLARIADEVGRFAGTLTRIDEATARTEVKVDAHEEISQHRHAELIAAIEALAAVSREKDVPKESLRPILERLGLAGVPIEQIPARLSEAADELIRLRADLARPRNDRPEFAALRARALALIDKGDPEAARRALQEGRSAARDAREELSRVEAGFLLDEARIDRLRLDHDLAAARFAEAVTLDPDNVAAWVDQGDLWVLRGSLAKAEAAFRGAAAAATSSGNQRHLSVTYERIGDVQIAQGRLDDALKSFRDNLAIRQTLAASNPGNAQWQRDLAVSFDQIGEVHVLQGRLDDALKSFRDGLAIAETLAASDAGNIEWQRDLSVSFTRIGEVHVSQGRLNDALKSFRDGLAIAETLAASDAGNTEWQRDLSVSFNKIGDVQISQGRLNDALKSFRDGLAIAETLAATDPGNAGWRRDLSVSLDKIGHVQISQGRLDDALTSFRDGFAIAETLAASDVSNAEWQRDLSVSFNKIGDVQISQGRLDDALKSFRDGLAIRETLAASDPSNAGWQRNLSVSFNNVGDVQVAQSRLDDALKSYRDGLAIRETLAAADSGNAKWQRDLSVSFEKIGDVQLAQGRFDDALMIYRDSLGIAETLAALDPGNARWQRDLSVSFEKIGDVQLAQGHFDDALMSYRDSLGIAETLAALDPHNTRWRRDLASLHTNLAIVHSGRGDAAAARSALLTGRAIMIELTALSPGNAVWREDLDKIERELEELS